jgi:predicted nucleic acid-binding protein
MTARVARIDAPMLIDSAVLVWLTRGHVGAAKRLHAIDAWRISVVTCIELAQGCRDKADLARLKKGARRTQHRDRAGYAR